MPTPIGVIISVQFYVVLPWECFCLLSAQCVNFVCNEGNAVQLSARYITLCDCLLYRLDFLSMLKMFVKHRLTFLNSESTCTTIYSLSLYLSVCNGIV